MNLILRFLVVASLYIGVVGGLLLLIRSVLNQINSSQITVYKLWYIFLIGFVLLFVFYHAKTVNIYFNSIESIHQFATTVTFSNPSNLITFDKITYGLLSIIWGCVSMGLLINLLCKYLYLKKLIHIDSKSNVIESSYILVPIAFGILKPKIFIPESYQQEYNLIQQKLLIAHEQIHCERKDPLMLIIYQVLICLFWFHPVVYLLNNRMKNDQELSCDELVLRQNSQQLEYSKLLFKLNQLNLNQLQTELYCSSTSMLKERIMLIKKSETKSIINNLISKSIVMACVCGLVPTTSVIAEIVKPEDNFKIISPELVAIKKPQAPPSPKLEKNRIVPLIQPKPYYPRRQSMRELQDM